MSVQQRSIVSPSIESLEPRRHLAAVVVGGELQILGTHLSDNIRVYVNPRTPDQLEVIVNRTVERFFVEGLTGINLNAGQGNDRVVVEGKAPRYSIPTRLYGSGGNDTIFGGDGRDRIYGGSGNDSINGGRGNDVIYGEAGSDRMDGDVGNDYMVGGFGNDTLIGWLGIDYLLGEAGDDFFDSKDGYADRVDGGSGFDRGLVDTILDQTFISIELFVQNEQQF